MYYRANLSLLCSMSQPGVTGVLCSDNQGLALAGMYVEINSVFLLPLYPGLCIQLVSIECVVVYHNLHGASVF